MMILDPFNEYSISTSTDPVCCCASCFLVIRQVSSKAQNRNDVIFSVERTMPLLCFPGSGMVGVNQNSDKKEAYLVPSGEGFFSKM